MQLEDFNQYSSPLNISGRQTIIIFVVSPICLTILKSISDSPYQPPTHQPVQMLLFTLQITAKINLQESHDLRQEQQHCQHD